MKNNKLLGIIAVVIFILLILVMFILPDSVFLAIENAKNTTFPSSTSKTESNTLTLEYEDKISKLKENKFDYEYKLIYSTLTDTYTFECSGTRNNDKEDGKCTIPEEISYTEETKNEVFSTIDVNLLDVEYIFEIIKDIEPEETKISLTTTEYKYVTYLNKYETDIIITTNLTDITQIVINNVYMTYLINYTI